MDREGVAGYPWRPRSIHYCSCGLITFHCMPWKKVECTSKAALCCRWLFGTLATFLAQPYWHVLAWIKVHNFCKKYPLKLPCPSSLDLFDFHYVKCRMKILTWFTFRLCTIYLGWHTVSIHHFGWWRSFFAWIRFWFHVLWWICLFLSFLLSTFCRIVTG